MKAVVIYGERVGFQTNRGIKGKTHSNKEKIKQHCWKPFFSLIENHE